MNEIKITGFADEIHPSLDAQLEALREFGVSALELRAADGVNVSDFTPQKLREVKEKLNAAGITVSAIGSPIGKISIEEEFGGHIEKLKRTLEIQRELDAPYLRMFSFYIPKGQDPARFSGQVLERLGAMCQEAERWDAVLLHENEKGIFGDTAPRCLELMKALAGAHFQAVFDFANFVEVGQPTLEAFGLLRPYIRYIHIKDCTAGKKIVPAGQGEGHVEEILSQLFCSGWRGYLSLEPHLVDFAGLAALERDPARRGGNMDGKTAWAQALAALRGILAGIPTAASAGEGEL